MFNHSEFNNEHITLHDCCANSMNYENGVLSFVFPEGFWVTPQHNKNDSDKIVRTDLSQVDFELLDRVVEDVRVYIFRENENADTIREEWELEDFINKVNAGIFKVEFIDEYKTYQSYLYKCWVRFEDEPYHYECEIIIDTKNVAYNWNKLRYECEW